MRLVLTIPYGFFYYLAIDASVETSLDKSARGATKYPNEKHPLIFVEKAKPALFLNEIKQTLWKYLIHFVLQVEQ